MFDGDASRGKHGLPLGSVEGAVVAGIAQALELLHNQSRPSIVRQKLILQQQYATHLQYTRAFRDEGMRVGEMMRRDAAGHQVKPVGIKWQDFGIRLSEGDIKRAVLLDYKALGLFQHSRCQVAGDHMPDAGRELERRMTAAGSDIEDLPVRLRLRDRQQTIQVRAFGVRFAGDIAVGVLRVSLLRRGFGVWIGTWSMLWFLSALRSRRLTDHESREYNKLIPCVTLQMQLSAAQAMTLDQQCDIAQMKPLSTYPQLA